MWIWGLGPKMTHFGSLFPDIEISGPSDIIIPVIEAWDISDKVLCSGVKTCSQEVNTVWMWGIPVITCYMCLGYLLVGSVILNTNKHVNNISTT